MIDGLPATEQNLQRPLVMTQEMEGSLKSTREVDLQRLLQRKVQCKCVGEKSPRTCIRLVNFPVLKGIKEKALPGASIGMVLKKFCIKLAAFPFMKVAAERLCLELVQP